MNKKLFSIMAIAMAAFTFTACDDVPEPYEIPGNGGNTGGDTPGGDPIAYIYNETVGNDGSASDKPFVDVYTGWAKNGSGASNVTYSGTNASVRNSGISNTGAYDNASGPNVVFFGNSASFIINKIALTSEQTKLRLTFGASSSIRNDDGSYNNSFDDSKFTVSLSADGTTWTPITYTKNDGDQNYPYWVYATSDFTLKQAAGELYIKFDAKISSAIRLDDISLTTGEGGQEVDLGEGGTLPPAGDATPITIAEIKNMMTTEGAVIDATTNRYFEGVVQNDTENGNYSTNNLFVAMENATEAGQGVVLYGSQVEPKTLGLKTGDKVRVTLIAGKAKAQDYSGLYEITGAKDDTWCNVEKIGTATVTPLTINAAALANLAAYQGMTVKVNNATTNDNNNWGAGTHTFTTEGTDFTVYANQGCTFTNNTIDNTKTGSVTGIVTLYRGAAQIVPRTNDDVKDFSVEGGDTPEPPVTGDGMTADIIIKNKTGNVELGTNAYQNQDVTNESTWYTWSYDNITYRGAKICIADGKNGTGIQMQGNDSDKAKQGFIFNQTAFGSDIQSVTIIFTPVATTKYDPSYSFYAGTTAHPTENSFTAKSTSKVEGNSKVYTETFDLSAGSYKYFTIYNNKAGALYISKIIVTLK